MKYLIDTQIVIWSLTSPEKITATNQNRLQKGKIFVSQVSLFEIAIKQKIGKLPHLNISIGKLIETIEKDSFEILYIKDQHIANYTNIPLFDDHRDPFDRLILATALYENLPIISSDEKFALYDDIVTIFRN